MGKNMIRKIILIIVLAVVSVFLLALGIVCTLHIAKRVLRPSIEKTGGTILVYEIDTQGLTSKEKEGLTNRMIRILQRRVDPEGMLGLLWRPLGDTRFEVIMPASSHYSLEDLQRMLKGAGILEFRILPTLGHPKVDTDEMTRYIEALKEKGPKYSSDNKYVWCEIENIKEWNLPNSVVAQFGDKSYVLTSNKENETLLYSGGDGQRAWKLEEARPSQDGMGRRAIGFTLDDKGGRLFANVTGKNIDRPLCILLDEIAISAPTIQSRIYRQGIITGSFTQVAQDEIVNKLNAGCLPARLVEQPISVKTIGPSIGTDNLDKGTPTGKKLLKDNN